MNISKVTGSVPSGVAVVALDGSVATDFEIFPEEEHLLSPSVSPARATEFRLGRRAAHLALAELGEPGPVLRGAKREPIWPEGITGSITHAGDHALAIVASLSVAGGIGIDLEIRTRFFPDLEREIAVAVERAALGRLDGQARRDATLEIFSAKESIYKAVYPRIGRFFGFDAARIEFGPENHLTGHFTTELDPRYPPDRPMNIGRMWSDEMVLTWLVLSPDPS